MKRVWRYLLVGLAFLSFGAVFPSQILAGAGTESAAFLDIPVGAGPAALGGAYSALASDAYASIWNPAGLGFVPNTQLATQHLSYLESIHYEQISLAYPFKANHAIGFSAQYLGSGDITGRDDQGALNGDFSNHYGAYALSYGQTLTPRLSFGITTRMIEAKLSDISAKAYSMDAGILYKPTDKLNVAGVVAQAGTKMKFLNEAEPLPLQARLGLAYTPNSQLTVSAETAYHPESELFSNRVGVQWRPLSMIALRAGYKTDGTKDLGGIRGLTTGMAIDLWGQELAYAWVPYGDLGNTQYFSLLLRFGAAEEARRNLIQFQNPKVHHAGKDGKGTTSDPTEPEYQQLMQLLSDNSDEIVRGTSKP